MDTPTIGSVPYFVRSWAERGWDIVRVNFPDGYQSKRIVAENANFLRSLGQTYRSKGYGRIVLAGQSTGGFQTLHALAAPNVFSAGLVSGPSSHGQASDRGGRPNQEYYLRRGAILAAVKSVTRTPIAFVAFAEDPFGPIDVATEAREILQQKRVPNFVLDGPRGLSGHGAWWTAYFDFLFGDCLEHFVDAPALRAESSCEKRERDYKDHRWMTKEQELRDAGLVPATSAWLRENLVGETLVYTEKVSGLYLGGDGKAASLRRGDPDYGYNTHKGTWHISTNSQLCIETSEESSCRRVYPWPDGELIFVDEDGAVTSRWLRARGDVMHLAAQ